MRQSEADDGGDMVEELGAKMKKGPSASREVTDERPGGPPGGSGSGEEDSKTERAIAEDVLRGERTDGTAHPGDGHTFDNRRPDTDAGEETLEGDNGYELTEEMVVDALESADGGTFLGRLHVGFHEALHHLGSLSNRVIGDDRLTSGSVRESRNDSHRPEGWKLTDRLRHFASTEGADESELMDEAAELAASGRIATEEAIPVMAGLAVRKLIRVPLASVPRQLRRRLVHAVAAATRDLVTQHESQAIRALSPIVRSARRIAVSQRTSIRELPRLVQQLASRVARSPHTIDRVSRSTRILTGPRRPADQGSVPQSLWLRGPVHITIEGSYEMHDTRLADHLFTEPSKRQREPDSWD